MLAGRRLSPLVTAALLAGAWLVGRPAAAQSIQAEIDRTEATVEDQLRLTLTVIGSQSAQPVLPPLPEFEVIAAGTSKQWSFSNGRASSRVAYTYLLLPRSEGEFEIGAATVEIDDQLHSSRPIRVRIVATSAEPRQSRDLFLTASLSTSSPFVGQQVLFTWRLYRRLRIADARLDPFEFEGFLVEDLGDVREFETTVNGQTFLVSEIRKALFPQETGTLTIPPTRLSCQVVVGRQQSGRGAFDDFFGRPATATRVLRSDPLAVEVRPLPQPPPGFSGLVGSFELASSVSQDRLRAGESTTLVVEVSGRGNVQMIPEPRLPEMPAFKVYDDKPGADIVRGSSGMSGSRSFRKALVAQRPGEHAVPPLELVYFDPEAESYRTARSAEIPLAVEAAEGQEELRLTETIAPSTGKVAVRILAEDILPLYGGVDALTQPGRPERRRLALGLLTPPLAYLGLWAAARRRRRYREDRALARRQRAAARARRRLKRVEGGDAEALSRCLREFVGDKLGLEGVALTPQEVRNHLARHGVDEAAVASAGRLLDRLEAAQYGAGGKTPDGLSGEVADLIRQLDRQL